MSKSVRLSEETYERLHAHKRDDETFSDVVLRLAGERSLLELAGILSDEEPRRSGSPSTNDENGVRRTSPSGRHRCYSIRRF